ncbi:leukocyte immunoglobulin-like receptor subfamily A member 6 [Apteryx mantelli]|uniref:Leukocyte immunoglobulin-like receptor subfamily A member 6 n=1 Tax=Apteryx mantelli TaxID=2696672 RepID=A0ABM4FZL8_9AVES
MATTLVLLGLGWWLVAPSGVQGESRPSLSLHPSEEVALGDTVTLRCRVPRPGVRVVVYKEGDGTYRWHRDGVEDTAEFSVKVLTWNYAGRYQCRFQALDQSWTSEPSDPVELLVLESRPSLSLHPSEGVAVGDMVTLRCRVPRPGVRVVVYREAGGTYQWYEDGVEHTAEFSVKVLDQCYAGRYRCRFEILDPFWTSEPSDPVELLVLATQFPPPTMSLSPRGRMGTGTNVTIRCQSVYGATFILHKAGSSVPIRHQDVDRGDAATFVLPGVTPSDAGTYGCSYRPRGFPFISSRRSPAVTLEVGPGGAETTSPPPRRPPDSSWSNALRLGLGAGVLLLLAALSPPSVPNPTAGPASSCPMAPMAMTLVLLGLESRPSLSLCPSKGVAVGDTVTLRCRVPQRDVRVVVYKEGDETYQWHRDGVEDTAEFSVKVSDRCYAGRYRCQFEILELSWTSELSDPVELVVLESRPSLLLRPSEGVAVGDTVTLRCCVPHPGVRVQVYQEAGGTYRWYRDGVKDTAKFSVEVETRSYAGRYRCRFETLDPSWASEPSDPVELLVLATQYPPPTMSLSPGGRVGTGTNVTIWCRSTYGATFILHKAGSLVPIQRQDVDRGDTATFVLPGVTPSDAGTYGCSYRPHGWFPFASSRRSPAVALEVEPGGPSTAPSPLAGASAPCSGPPGAEEEKSSWNLAVVGGCAAALLVVVVIMIIVFLAAAPCCRRRRGKGPTVEPSRDPPELLSQDMVGDSSQDLRSLQLLEDAEGLTYAELRPPAPGAPGDRDAPSPSVIYAQVGGRGPC